MPLTPKGRKILRAMTREYGVAKGRQVFYASIRKGLISGTETGASRRAPRRRVPA